jgi:YD repeat-containing protein
VASSPTAPTGDPAGTITTQALFNDPNNPDKPTETIDAVGRQTYYQYDAEGDVLSVSRPHTVNGVTTNIVTSNHYDGHGHLLRIWRTSTMRTATSSVTATSSTHTTRTMSF